MAQARGCIIGSCSDRSLAAQQEIWNKNNIQVAFVSLKHLLSEVIAHFDAEKYYHIGDTKLDQQFALEAGFEFLWMDAAASEPWIDTKP